jgi:hypothetical protein
LQKLQYIDPDKNPLRAIKKPHSQQIAKRSAPIKKRYLSHSSQISNFSKWYHFLLKRGQKIFFAKFAIFFRQFTNAIRLQDKKSLMHVSKNSYQAASQTKSFISRWIENSYSSGF